MNKLCAHFIIAAYDVCGADQNGGTHLDAITKNIRRICDQA
jgi:hypothetical protein